MTTPTSSSTAQTPGGAAPAVLSPAPDLSIVPAGVLSPVTAAGGAGPQVTPDVVLVADYLTQRGGAERVVVAMADAFPNAALLTSVYDSSHTYPEFSDRSVRTLWTNSIGAFRRDPRAAFPMLALTWGRTEVEADVVFCSSSGWAHGVRTSGRKIVYCHNPARWLYQKDDYFNGGLRAVRPFAALADPMLRRWDARAALSADHYLVNSTSVRDRVRRIYGIDAEVLHPPVTLDPKDPLEPVPGLEPGFLLTVSRARAYKNTALVVAAVSRVGDRRLVVVGERPAGADPRTVVALSGIPDAQLRWLYANADALLAASHEDFGLTPVEANTFGTPVVALRAGGYLDSVVEGTNGVFFDEETPEAIVIAITALERAGLDRVEVARHAEHFGLARFQARLQELAAF